MRNVMGRLFLGEFRNLFRVGLNFLCFRRRLGFVKTFAGIDDAACGHGFGAGQIDSRKLADQPNRHAVVTAGTLPRNPRDAKAMWKPAAN